MSKIPNERLEELKYYFESETNDKESQMWRESLSTEEQKIIKAWDRKFLEVYTNLLKRIIDSEKQFKSK